MRFNDGKPVGRKLLAEILQIAFDTFGGYSLGSKQKGAWRDADGTRYDDETQRLEVVCDREQLTDAIEFVRAIGRKLDQRAMYFEVRDYDGVQILQTE